MSDSELLLGIDVGTTSLSLTLIGAQSHRVVHSLTLLSDAGLPGAAGMQDAVQIERLTLDAVASLLDAFPGISSIGVTGQMHGVLCLDEDGQSVSPLYTWQDLHADGPLCDEILSKTGYRVHPGYGHATLYALRQMGLLPDRACQYCTIMDYIAMRLTGRKTPIMHSTNAASLGLFDLRANCFDEAALRILDLSPLHAPQVVSASRIVGYHKNIPVSIAIGDNQASFFGSMPDETHSLLLNYGTGSQLSLVCESPDTPGGEVRPYLNGKYLLCHSALCGGRAYALLRRFFSQFAMQADLGSGVEYDLLNAMAQEAYDDGLRLRVNTQFCGMRGDPDRRGSIVDIGEDNFTPGALALGILQGMVDELHDGFDRNAHPDIRRLVASGNAVRKNPVLRTLLADTFSMPLFLTAQQEEAALGAALFGGVCAGILSMPAAKSIIRLQRT